MSGVIRLLLAYGWEVAEFMWNPYQEPETENKWTQNGKESKESKETENSKKSTFKTLLSLPERYDGKTKVEVWSASCPRSYLWALYADGTIVPPEGKGRVGDPLFFAEYLHRHEYWGA